MVSGREYWDNKYRNMLEAAEPSAFLVQMLPRLQRGKVLDIAMGRGENAVHLASHGFSVKGFDLSEVAIQSATALAKQKEVQIEAKQADLDLFLMGLMEYDSIIMVNFKPAVKRYYSELVRALKQGGTLLVDSLTVREMKEPLGKEDAYKDYYFKTNELLQNLTGLKILFYQEFDIEGVHRVQCIAQKALDKDAVKYNLFDMHSNQKDSGPSAQLKLAEQLFKKKD